MSAIIQFVPPAELFFRPAKKDSLFANRGSNPIHLSPIGEPKQGFWKPAAPAVSLQFAVIELFVLVVFLSVALVAAFSCFGELSRLLDNDAIGQIAMKVAGGGL
jgi:hypothetical protein